MIIRATTGALLGTMADDAPLLPFHFESDVELNAPANAVFSHLDDHSRLSAHMSESSWMMMGSRMVIELDATEGRAVGAIIRLRGRVLGIPLSVEQIVTERNPPLRKIWATMGRPHLLVIGPYRMGYEITPKLTLRSFACSSTMPWQTDPFHIGSAACSATSTPAGALSAWPTMLRRTSKHEVEYLAIHASAPPRFQPRRVPAESLI